MSISVCIGTYGDYPHWSKLVHERAMPSVDRQTVPADRVRWSHGPNLHEARNDAASKADTEWLCFLDADDELDERYLEAMTAATDPLAGDWLVQPATLGVAADGHEDLRSVLIPAARLIDRNWMVIGTLIRTEQFRRVGGFAAWPCFEDWELWLRAWIDNARLTTAPDAVYRVHVNEAGRNNGARSLQLSAYGLIRQRHRQGATEREARDAHAQ